MKILKKEHFFTLFLIHFLFKKMIYSLFKFFSICFYNWYIGAFKIKGFNL